MGCVEMAVTVAAVIKNMCLSRCRKAEDVTYRICIQTPTIFALLVIQKADQASVCPAL
jgi:hypothetical protein